MATGEDKPQLSMVRRPNVPPPGMPPIDLVIHFEGGQVKVGGPIADKVLCYGLLGAAHDAIFEYHRQLAEGKIGQPPSGSSLYIAGGEISDAAISDQQKALKQMRGEDV